jgi:hypothetical protein
MTGKPAAARTRRMRNRRRAHRNGPCLLRLVPAAVLMALAVGPARADMFEPQMAEVCRPVAGGPSRVSPRVVLKRVLRDISDIDLDKDGATLSDAQKVEALLAGPDYCAGAGANCDPKTRDATNAALGRIQSQLTGYLQRHTRQVDPVTGGYQFAFVVTGANLRAFFLDPKSGLAPACVASAGSAPGMPNPPVADDKSRADWQFRVRNSVADLAVGQGESAFKGLQRASFSVNSDRLQSSTTYNIQGVVGAALGQTPIPSWSGAYLEVTPYVSYTSQFVDGNNPKKLTDVENIGAGVTGDLLFPALGFQNLFPLTRGMYNDLQFGSQIVHSARSGMDVASGRITYTPYINPTVVPGIATTARVGDFLVMLMPRGVFIYGDVINNGKDPVPTQTGTFQRLGTHLEFSANADAGALNGFGFNVSYDYLKSLGAAPLSQIALFTAALSYTLPKQEYWSVQLKYTDGRNLDTLEQQRLVTLGIGLKY